MRVTLAASFGVLMTFGPPAAGQDADEGVRGIVRKDSIFTKVVPVEKVEEMSADAYRKMLAEAAAKGALAPATDPQVIRLRAIAQRLLPYTAPWNARASRWQWEVNLVRNPEPNASCLPGGKIFFNSGILTRLQLTDDEVAAVMGHEVAHALREHARERIGKGAATQKGAQAVSSILGLHTTGNAVVGFGAQLLTLRFSRQNESEADVVGMELAARAGYDPNAGITLWQKMGRMSEGAAKKPEFMSTHPADARRMLQIEGILPRVLPIYDHATKPPRVFGPPAAANG